MTLTLTLTLGVETQDWMARCDVGMNLWNTVKGKTPKLKASLRPVQDREGRRNKQDIVAFHCRVEEYKESFKHQTFYDFANAFAGGEAAFAAIQNTHAELTALEGEIAELEHLAKLFECAELVTQPL